MDGYLAKPIDPQLLFAAVEQAGDGPAAEPVVEGPVTFQEDALLRRLSGDRELMADVIRVFLEDLPDRLTAAERAVGSRDAVAIHEAAHAIKGAASNLSAGRLFEAAQALETAGAEKDVAAAAAALRRLAAEADAVVGALSAAGRTS
jgi:two-component system sensor histidine kinase/response regulator